MDPVVVAAMLAASLLHASWHALVKSSGDRVIALAGMNLVSGLCALVMLPFSRTMPPAAYLVIAGSVALHAGYKIALARLYGQADLGQAYPLARGMTPIMASALAFLLLGDAPGTIALGGIGLVCGGLVVLAFEQSGRRMAADTFGSAAVAGLAVAAYSVVDAYGVRLARDWFSFTVWLVAADSAAFVAYALATRRARALETWRANPGRTLVSGALGVISFGVFMWALGRAPVGPVSALRETSVVFAAIIGTVILREHATWVRFAAALLVMCGVAAIALAR